METLRPDEVKQLLAEARENRSIANINNDEATNWDDAFDQE